MITLIQRVSSASVSVNDQRIGQCAGQGILALIAIEPTDTPHNAQRLVERILNYRIFADRQHKMNLSLRDIEGGLLIVPQFTLAANTDKGNRPSFTSAASPELAQKLFAYVQSYAKQHYPITEFGQFGADMQVALVNDGPVTFKLCA